MPRMPIPRAHWPHSPEDRATIDARLGGVTTIVEGPPTLRADGEQGPPSYVEYWLEYPSEPSRISEATPREPDDPRVRTFLRDLARRSARAWVNAAMEAKGRRTVGDRVDEELPSRGAKGITPRRSEGGLLPGGRPRASELEALDDAPASTSRRALARR